MNDYYDSSIKRSLEVFGPQALNTLRRFGILYSLVKQQFIEEATATVDVSEELMQKALTSHYRENHIKDENSLCEWLENHFLNKEELLHQVSLPLKVSKLALEKFGMKAESQFLNRKEELDQFTYSLLRVQDSGTAHELYLQLEANEASFENLARDHSQGPERKSAGKVGPCSLMKAHPQLQKILKTATPGIVQEPILIEQWWVVTRLDERHEASFDDTMRQRMASELLQDWLTIEAKAVVKSLLSAENGISML